MRINKHDTQGTKPLLGKGELGYDDYTAGGDVGRVYVGTGTENIALAEKLEANMRTKAQFNALAEERKANRAGSGFDEWGKHIIDSIYPKVNEGIFTGNSYSNYYRIGYSGTSAVGTSKSEYPIVNINGVTQSLSGTGQNAIGVGVVLPTAPTIYPHDTVLTTEQINSGVIKHADSSNSGLIVNGKFDVDTSGWTNHYPASTIESIGGMLKATNVGGAYAGVRTIIPTIIGKTYIMEVDTGVFSEAYIIYGIGTTVGNDNIKAGGFGNSNQKYKVEFTATSTTTHILVRTSNNTVGNYVQIDNIAVYPADAISRSDLVFLESWHEDVSEKNFVYPLGNTQYLGGNTYGLTGIANGAFTGYETYSLFGNWQTPSALIGKGYVWSNLTEAQKRAFIANPENNCYLDGDKVIQVRYRVRVVQGWGDDWHNVSDTLTKNIAYENTALYGAVGVKGKAVSLASDLGNYHTLGFYRRNNHYAFPENNIEIGAWHGLASSGEISSSFAYEGKCFALPIALVHRRNQGMYHNVYNPNGTKVASDGLDCFRTAVSFTSISDCFNSSKLLTASGYIGTVSGRPDGLFYDQVHESDILDLRNSSKKVEDYNRLISREFNKLVAGTTRGGEGEWEIKYYFSLNITAIVASVWQGFTSYRFAITPPVEYRFGTYNGINHSYKAYYINGSNITEIYAIQSDGYFFIGNPTVSSGYVVIAKKSTRTKSNTLLHCDIIGNPSNYPTSWKESGVSGTPLIVAEDGTSLLPNGAKDTFKLSRKANATPLLCLRSTDNGATWTSFTPTFSTTTNAITLTDEPAGNLVMVYYRTHTSMAVPVVNSEVLEIGDVFASRYYYSGFGAYLGNTLFGKTNTGLDEVPRSDTKSLSNYTFIEGSDNVLMTSSNYMTTHNTINLFNSNSSTAYKVFPYLTRANGKAFLNLVFKEMKHNGTSWGDDNKFNIVDNVSTTTDNNAQTVLIGQKTVELPYFIGADE